MANAAVELSNAKGSLSQIESQGKTAQSPYVVSKGDFVAAPIPFSNPTIGSGLAGVLAYFYPQDTQQKASQPPSVTGLDYARSNLGDDALYFSVGEAF